MASDGTAQRSQVELPFIDLLRRSREGGAEAESALEALMTELYLLAWRFLRPRLTSWRDATDVINDVAQETVVRLYLNVDTCRASTSSGVAAWALTTARHTLIDMLRSPASGLMGRQLAAELDQDLNARDEHRVDRALAESPEESAGTRPAERAARETLLRLAVEAYNGAAEETGELLWWRLVMGSQWTDIANEMSTTAAGAKRRFQRAQAMLERNLTDSVRALPPDERGEVSALIAYYLAPEAGEVTPDSPISGSNRRLHRRVAAASQSSDASAA